MKTLEIISLIASKERQDYKCYNILKKLLDTNKEFKETIVKGIAENKIEGFTEDLWDKINEQNIRGINNFNDVFYEGANIGYCTVASKQLSYSLNNCYICGGILPILSGTENCIDGSHTWLEKDDNIIDTSLMLIINKEYSKKIGYIEQNKYDPNIDPIYCATKDFTLDPNLRKRKNTL